MDKKHQTGLSQLFRHGQARTFSPFWRKRLFAVDFTTTAHETRDTFRNNRL
jgi:hypothetical protein